MENKVKRLLLISILMTAAATQGFAQSENMYGQYYGSQKKVEFATPRAVPQIAMEEDTIFSAPKNEPQGELSASQMLAPKAIIVTKEMKKRYKEITSSTRLIEACELLKGTAGDFSYKSIQGTNKTKSPIKISFKDFSKDSKHKNSDAYGTFVGRKYEIFVNSKYQNAPAAAIAPTLAREALVSKDKTDSDTEAAEQIQIAVWSQMLERNSALNSSTSELVALQNKLKRDGNFDEYSAFFKQASAPKSKTSVPPTKIMRQFGKGAPTQSHLDVAKQELGKQVQSDILSYDSDQLQKKYKKITKEDRIIEALELLKTTAGKFSYDAILGNNLTHKPMQITFKNLGEIKREYSTFDALGWRQKGTLFIYINHKHADAPAAAIAAVLAHEALHQDEFDSLNEETYAWTMEASVWTQLCDRDPDVADIAHPLVTRENLLKKLLEKGEYSNKYIKKSVFSNPSYSKLPVRSPGFESD